MYYTKIIITATIKEGILKIQKAAYWLITKVILYAHKYNTVCYQYNRRSGSSRELIHLAKRLPAAFYYSTWSEHNSEMRGHFY